MTADSSKKAGGEVAAFNAYEAPFGDGVYRFRLDIDALRELQDKTDAGPAFLLHRIVTAQWRVDDLRETIRLGLIGGGVEPIRALALVQRYFDNRGGYGQHQTLAALVLQAAIFEPEELTMPGKKRPSRRGTRAGASGSASSSEPPPQ